MNLIHFGSLNIPFHQFDKVKVNSDGGAFTTKTQNIQNYFSYITEFEFNPKFIVWITQNGLSMIYEITEFYNHMNSLDEWERNLILNNDTFYSFMNLDAAEYYLDILDDIKEIEWLIDNSY